jgi:hypothetical protein
MAEPVLPDHPPCEGYPRILPYSKCTARRRLRVPPDT